MSTQDEETILNDIQAIHEENSKDIYELKENVIFNSNNKYDIPELELDMCFDEEIKGVFYRRGQETKAQDNLFFLYRKKWLEEVGKNNICGFFLNDNEFEVVYKDITKMTKLLKSYSLKALMQPNFSIWIDDPLPIQLFNKYKANYVAKYWQKAGFKIIPNLNWSDSRSYDFCFLGIPKNCPCVIVECRSGGKNNNKKDLFLNGLYEAYEKINFKKVYIYGGKTFFKNEKIIDNKINYCYIDSYTEFIKF